MKIQTLIHTALIAEAKPIIGCFHLKCIERIPFNVYQREGLALIVSGIGAKKTEEALKYVLSFFEPCKIINIGIAGCSDKNIKIGSLFCATHKNISIPYASLSSHENAVGKGKDINSCLIDQEGEAFLSAVPESIERYIFKVVSDHLDTTVPTKAKVSSLMQKTLPAWSVYVR
ncbi:MAG: nucleoside phosphorylase [Campylobacteraceae bacterium]|jgi:hypothetical protein|nr:nucleoside phosphorylase [Campylobacteraceae bacterium]